MPKRARASPQTKHQQQPEELPAPPENEQESPKLYAEIADLESEGEEQAGADESEMCNYGVSPCIPNKAGEERPIY